PVRPRRAPRRRGLRPHHRRLLLVLHRPAADGDAARSAIPAAREGRSRGDPTRPPGTGNQPHAAARPFARAMKALVTHPGRQHSHQAALGLQAAGMLAGYWSGVPARAEQAGRFPALLRRRLARYAAVPLKPGRVRWFPWTPALRRLGDALLPAARAAWVDLLACRLFDRWAAGRLRRTPRPPDAVIACEISALATFRIARRQGITTILDAPSLHHQAQDRLHGTTD